MRQLCQRTIQKSLHLFGTNATVEGHLTDTRTLQGDQMRSGTESYPDVACQRTDIRSFAAYYPYLDDRKRVFQQFQLVDNKRLCF